MKILKRQGQKDYYDFLEQIYGIDELLVYDRRDAVSINPTKPLNLNVHAWFGVEPMLEDEQKKDIRRWKSKKIQTEEEKAKSTRKSSWEWIKEGSIYHYVLEIGYHHYYFEVERYLDNEDKTKLHLEYKLIKTKEINRKNKISSAPICLAPVSCQRYGWLFKEWEDGINFFKEKEGEEIENPILYLTYIPKCIDPDDVWNNLYEYISSLKEKEVTDTRTNDQHIESHGFDKKISFRRRKGNYIELDPK